MDQRPLDILKHYWGYESFRPMQAEIIDSVLAGNDTLALLPTGGGKSVCFQVPALMKPGICLVITPLVALMIDQVANLRKRGIPAAEIHSGMTPREIDYAYSRCSSGEAVFLYLSPERLGNHRFLDALRYIPVNLIAVDEAHCISQWGYDFRPPYLEIARLRQYFPDVPVLALTATAVPRVVDDIQEKLNFRKRNVFQNSFLRNNLSYVASLEEDKMGRLLKICRNVDSSGIVYVRNRRLTREIADWLLQNGIKAGYYHAGMDAASRAGVQDAWMKSQIKVIVATNAFGMGIDKPDVRFVVHLDFPDTAEAYFQEAGRAGRDGKRSYAVLLYDNSDIADARKSIELAWPEPEFIRKVYQALGNFFQIPVGSGLDMACDFELEQFCRNYNLNPVLTYNALKILEREGLLALTDSFNQPSTILFLVGKERLYKYQVENLRHDKLIKLLLRSFTGLFSEYVRINENEIARKLGWNTEEVVSTLGKIQSDGILDYNRRKNIPQLVFVCERLPADDIMLSKALYFDRKKEAVQKQEFLISYATSGICRNIRLLNYFGEKADKPCGICDVCIEKRKKGLTEEEFSSIREKVVSVLKAEPVTVSHLVNVLGIKEDILLTVIRHLVDEGILALDGEALVFRK